MSAVDALFVHEEWASHVYGLRLLIGSRLVNAAEDALEEHL